VLVESAFTNAHISIGNYRTVQSAVFAFRECIFKLVALGTDVFACFELEIYI
jgi:hypothetical protein